MNYNVTQYIIQNITSDMTKPHEYTSHITSLHQYKNPAESQHINHVKYTDHPNLI